MPIFGVNFNFKNIPKVRDLEKRVLTAPKKLLNDAAPSLMINAESILNKYKRRNDDEAIAINPP